jgi:hypothetical protein
MFPLSRLLLLMFLALLMAGCVSKSKARLEAQKAYIAGQQAAMAKLQTQNSVTVNGMVRNPLVPWNEDLTLGKAIVAADYYGKNDPGSIIVVHNGVGRRYDAKEVLKKDDILLAPGDVVQLLP